jgi:hypothetical protein
MLLIISEKLVINDIINYFHEEMVKFPIPSEWQKLDRKMNKLLEMCNIMSINLVKTEILFSDIIKKMQILKRSYWLMNRNSIKNQNKNKLNEMWNEHIAGIQVGSTHAHFIFSDRLKLLIKIYFSKTPFLKCYECRIEAYIEWVNDKDIHAKDTIFRNWQVYDTTEAWLNDCNQESPTILKDSIEAEE